MTLNAGVAPSGNFDLHNWKITLPVDSSGGYSGTAREVVNLAGYQNASYFATANDGAMVFRAPVEGATTSGSSYARSELREMNGSSRAAWNLSTGGVMTATLEVDQAPVKFDGSLGRVIVGQIHGADKELIRLYWEGGNQVYFKNDQAGSNNSELRFDFYNAAGERPNVSVDERFSYTIDAKGSVLEVKIYADGEVYTSKSAISSVWQSDTLYFKAGAYLGTNETQGNGFGQTSFYDLRFNHTDTDLTPASLTPAPAPGPAPVPAPTTPSQPVPEPGSDGSSLPTTTNTVTGTLSNNYVKGTVGNDVMYGLAGRDVFWGSGGSDVMYGGNDHDADGFVFNTALGNDVDVIMDFNPIDDYIRLDDAVFTSLSGVHGQLSQANFAHDTAKDANDFIVYDSKTGVLSYDADGSGVQAGIDFAVLHNHAQITAADFLVI